MDKIKVIFYSDHEIEVEANYFAGLQNFLT